MALYLDPPTGNMQLSKVEDYAKTRMKFLLGVSECRGSPMMLQDLMMESVSTDAADCLIEGSKKDNISHFLLRLACCAEPEMTQFFIQAETSFFNYRVSCMTEVELQNFVVEPLKKLIVFCRETERFKHRTLAEITAILSAVTCRIHMDELVGHIMDGVTADNILLLPFEFVPHLVATRAVRLHGGRALVPFTRFYVILTSIFERLLQYGLELARKQYPLVCEDKRLRCLFGQIKVIFRRHHSIFYPSMSDVSSDSVDNLVHQVPLCMSHLHGRLRRQHRLKHSDRIQYTLFLKEIGMPVHEALLFWREEYWKPSGYHGDCQGHSWQKDSRRYTYNIRHLYGLEGSRINYRAHCCLSLQGRSVGPQEAGGCPFTHFDADRLRSVLQTEGIPHQQREEIVSMATRTFPAGACQMYMKEKFVITVGIKRDVVERTLEETTTECHLPETSEGDLNRSQVWRCCHSNYSSIDLEELMIKSSKTCVENETLAASYSCPELVSGNRLALDKCSSNPSKKHTKNNVAEEQLSQRVTVSSRSQLDWLEESDATSGDQDLTNHGLENPAMGLMSRDLSSQLDVAKQARLHAANKTMPYKTDQPNCGVCCYEHNTCPDSQQPLTQRTLDRSFTTISEALIRKPSDFYYTFNRLLEGLSLK